ncbi:MAG: hypothetical protein JO257_25910, partial [Deltaproteobacteria bacterium]|nr:hypothetical protein [Deltaproteobacteria bacterium]
MSLPEKLHRDDEAKTNRPPELSAPNRQAAPQDPAAEHADAQAATGLANVAVSNTSASAAVGVPSAAGRAEAMELFREVNGGPGQAAPDAKAPSAKDKANAARLAPELDGGAPAAGASANAPATANGVGHAPSEKNRAEAMELFREVNGGPGEAAPDDVKANAARLAPELDGGAPAVGASANAPAKANGVGHAPSEKNRAEAMELFREVNGGPGEAAPDDVKANAARLAPELDGGAPAAGASANAPATANGVGHAPSEKNRAEAMELFREVNGGPGEPAPDAKVSAATAVNGPEVRASTQQARVAPQFNDLTPAKQQANAAALAPELDGGAPAKKPNGAVGVPSAAGRAEAMELFREVNGGPDAAAPNNKAVGVPSAAGRAEAMELFREVNGPSASEVKANAAALAPELDGGAPAKKPGGAVGVPSAAGRAEAMELFREVNGPSASEVKANAAALAPELDGGAPAKKPGGAVGVPSAAGRAEAMELFREVNGGPVGAAAAVNGPEIHASAQHAHVAPQFGDLTPAAAPATNVGGFAVHIAGGAAAAPKRLANVAVDHAEEAHDAKAGAAAPGDAAPPQDPAQDAVEKHKPALETAVGAAKDHAAAHAHAATSQTTGISKMDHQIHAPEAKHDAHEAAGAEVPHLPAHAPAKHAAPTLGAKQATGPVDVHAPMPKVDGHGTGLLVDPRPPAHDPEPLVDAEGNQVHYNPHSGKAPAPHASAHGGGHAAITAPPAPKLPDNLKSANQTQLDAFIAKAAADRDANKSKIQAKQLAKSAQVGVDAQVIAAQVKQKNEKELARLRAKADQDKTLAEQKAKEQQQQQGPVTIESLKEKLESTATADKQKLQIEFDEKRQELTVRLKAERETLIEQSQKQIDNFKTQQEAKKKAAEAAWTQQKTQMEQVAKDLMVQMRHQVEADQKRLEAEKDKLWAATNKKLHDLDTQTAANAAKVLADGNTKAGQCEAKAHGDAQAELTRAQGEAQGIRGAAQSKAAGVEDEGQKQSILNGAADRAQHVIGAAQTKATDIETKGKLNGKAMRAEAQKSSDAVKDAGKKARADVENAAKDQVAAIGKKINELLPLAQEKIKKAETDLKAKQDAGEAKLKAQFADTEAKIAKLKGEADAKLAKLDTDATTKLEKDYATAVAAIDKRVEVARAQLAAGNEKNIKQLQAMVDNTCKAIDKTVVDTEKQFEHTVLDAEKQAQAFIVGQLQKIKAEADKALAACDKTYEDQINQINAAAAATTKQIEETAKGKMLEVEVHTATLLNDIGDGSRMQAVQEQLKWYIKNKQPLPAGYGETAKPAEPAKKPADPNAPAAANDNAGAAPKQEEPEKYGQEKDKENTADIEAQKLAAEQRKKLLDPNDLSPEGVQAKLEESLKKGQKETADAHAQSATETVNKATKDQLWHLSETQRHKNDQLAKLESGNQDALNEVHKAEADEKHGKEAADKIQAAMAKTNWYGGSSPDKKAIMQALEGATPEQIEAMREALKAKGINLDDFVNKHMSGDEQKEARLRLTGDPIAGDLAALTGAGGHHMTGNEKLLLGCTGIIGLAFVAGNGDNNVGVDNARIQEILKRYPPGSPELEQLKAAYEKQTGRPFGEFLAQTGNESTAKSLGIEVPKADTRSKEEIEKEADKKSDAILADPKNAGKINAGTCGKSVADLNEALNGFHLDSTRAEKVQSALEGKSPEEMEYIRAQYKAQTGRDLDRDLEGRLSGTALAESKATLRNDKEAMAVNKILGAEEASWTPWTVDDKKMQDSLKELKDPAERRAVLEAYEKRTGRKLQDVIAEKMTGNDRELATALADGDELKARMVELDEATNGGWMNGMHKAIAERTGLNTEPLTRGLVNSLVSPVGAVAMAVAPDTKIMLPGGYELESGSIHKVDSDKIFELLENTPNPADRERLKDLYKQKTGHDMDADMAQKLVGPSGDQSKLDAYKAVQEGRMDDYHAARMDDAVSGLNDTKAFHAQLEGKSEMERKAIIEAYNRRHPEAPDAFNRMLDEQFGADSMDKQKAQLLATSKDDPTTGAVKLPDEFVLKYAQDSVWNRAAKSIDSATAVFDKYPFLYAVPIVGSAAAEAKGFAYFSRGWGVDNDAIKGVLQGKSKEEIEALKAKYPDLEKDLTYCLSGRDAFEVQLMLKDGEPKTDEEKIKRRLALYEFDRGEAGAWIPGMNRVSNGITDLISPSGEMMDKQADQLRKQLELIKAGGQLPPEAQAKLEASLGMMDESSKNFGEARSAVTDAMATAVGAVVGAAVTVLTGGVAGAILAALATGVATVATKVCMLGQSYGRNEMGVDLAMTAVQMATAGLGGGISKLSESFFVQVLNGAIGAAASNFAQTAITSKDAHDLLGLLAQATKSGMVGMLSGGANAAATAAIANAMQALSAKAFGPNAPLAGIMVKGFVSGAGGSIAGTFAEAMVDPDTLAGNWDQVFAKLAQGAATAGFQNGLTEAASAHHERMEQVNERAKSAVEEVKKYNEEHGKPRNIQEEQAAFAKAMKEGYEGVIAEQEAKAKASKDAQQQTPNPDEVQRRLDQHPPAENNEPQPAQHEDPQAVAKNEKVGDKPVEEIKQQMDELAAKAGKDEKLPTADGKAAPADEKVTPTDEKVTPTDEKKVATGDEKVTPVDEKVSPLAATVTPVEQKAATPEEQQAAEPKKKAKTPEELAKDAQQRANRDREQGITKEQRETFDAIDKLALDAKTPADFEYIRQLEVEAKRPVSERFSHNDDELMLQAMERETGSHGVHADGTPVTAEEHQAAVDETHEKLLAAKVQEKAAAHDQAVDELTAEQKAEYGLRDHNVTKDIVERAVPNGEGRKEVTVDAAISLGMGGAGAAGAHGDQAAEVKPGEVRKDRIGIEDASKPELWGTLGHKEMGQEASAISYGRDGVKTGDIAEHDTAMPAKASDLALQVAAQRNSSGVGTVESQGAIGPLEFKPIHDEHGKITGYEVGVPTQIEVKQPDGTTKIETIVVKTKQGVDISTGMGPARELLTEDSGPRKQQIKPEDAQSLKSLTDEKGQVKQKGPELISGEQALAMKPEDFAGQRVLGIGGGPTSEWAMEHAANGGAKSVEVAGQMPRPKTGPLAERLNAVEAEIRTYVSKGEKVPEALTEKHHQIVEEHVAQQQERITKANEIINDPNSTPLQRERAEQDRARIASDIDPFLGSRVDRNHETLNSEQIKHVQADVIQVKPIKEGGKTVVEVTYADGTTRIVDRVIPSIGANPDQPGGIHKILDAAPPEMKLIPVISGGRCVGLESEPAGISISGAAMVGTLGTNMPPEVLKRIPPEMRDAVVSSIIDHAYREGVSAGSKGIVPGIENVGTNTELTIETIKKIPKEQRSTELEAFLREHQTERDLKFGGENRFPELQPKSGTVDQRVAKLNELEQKAPADPKAAEELAKLRKDPEWQDAIAKKAAGPEPTPAAPVAETPIQGFGNKGKAGDTPVPPREERIAEQRLQGHAGIEVHNHFMGNVEPEGFLARLHASNGEALPEVNGKPAVSTYEGLLHEIVDLSLPKFDENGKQTNEKVIDELAHKFKKDPKTGDPVKDPETGKPIIERRGVAGDAIEHAKTVEDRIKKYKEWLEDPDLKPEEKAYIKECVHEEAKSAVDKALRASNETDFNSSYAIRDELVKGFYGDGERAKILGDAYDKPFSAQVEAYREHFEGRPRVLEMVEHAEKAQAAAEKPGLSDGEKKTLQEKANAARKVVEEQVAYDRYAKDTILALAKDGITYTEQSNSLKKMEQRFDPEQLGALKRELALEHPQMAEAIEAIEIKHLAMITTNEFGSRDPNVSHEDLDPRVHDRKNAKKFNEDVNRLMEQVKRGDTTGVDIAGAEFYSFDAEGQRRMAYLYNRLAAEARASGQVLVLRPHVGEGANDTVTGKHYGRDNDRQMVGNELSHYKRARENIDAMITAFEHVAKQFPDGKLPP